MTFQSSSSGSLTSLLVLLSAVLAIFASDSLQVEKKFQQREMNSDAIVPLRSHSIYAPYVDSNLQNKFWDFGADAIVDTNRHIRLTQDRPSQMGWLWSRLPLSAENYEVVFEFSIDGKASHLSGDGLAMWLTTERAKPGPVFGNMNYFTGLGIFFDTYPNSRHTYTFPRISVMMGNGVEAYENKKDGARQEIAGCSIDFRRTKVATKARLTHVKGVYTELAIHHKEWDQWETCFMRDNITMPLNPYLGFTALTGDVSDNHDIVSVQSHNIVYKPRSAEQLARDRAAIFAADKSTASTSDKSYQKYDESGQARGKGGGLIAGLFHLIYKLVKWSLILAVIAAILFAGLKYQKQQNAKRF
ncbi:hypothetical protein IE53DRAFT_68185 [Violaceomyces palustris]|uniref:Uncharacterized protein n=1 Tax=Violaceomyces palustris TaxID=1673888 RepID=A0ACD0NYU6_9BASI|nr:hypothetical protein IE53DRAFT_68185 [Violaceomyces palustris]